MFESIKGGKNFEIRYKPSYGLFTLVIFFLMLVFGTIFYNHYSQGHVQELKEFFTNQYVIAFILLSLIWFFSMIGYNSICIGQEKFSFSLRVYGIPVMQSVAEINEVYIEVYKDTIRVHRNNNFFTIDGIKEDDLEWMKEILDEKLMAAQMSSL